MALIEGIGDDVITLVFILFTIVIIIISWLSTSVREFAFPANLLVIERRSRRLYTANINGNLSRINTSRLSTTGIVNPSNASTSTNTNDDVNTNSGAGLANANGGSPANIHHHVHHHHANNNIIRIINTRTNSSINVSRSAGVGPGRSSANELELVNEMVEQALVDNLLDGEFFATNDIDLIQSQHNNASSSNNNNNSNGEQTLGHATSLDSSTRNTNSENSNSHNTIENNGDVSNQSAESATSDSQSSLSVLLNNTGDSSNNEDLINILIRFVNEKEMKIQAKPDDTILFLKRTHFGQELSSNKIVRFIYQGQFLCDKNTVKSYNIKDQTTIHCHITTKPQAQQQQQQPQPQPVQQAQQTEDLIQAQFNSIRLRNGENVAPLQTGNSLNTNVNSNESNNNVQPRVGQRQLGTISTIINIDLNNLLLPFFAIILGVCWYFRVNFKHFFSPLSTLILVIFTFIYALFLFNNIHSTSTMAANNLILHSRLLRRRQNQNQAAQVVNQSQQ